MMSNPNIDMSHSGPDLFKALLNFKSNCPVILKETEGYGYKYADISTINSIIDPVLMENGLFAIQPIDDGHIVTHIIHADTGQRISSRTKIPNEQIQYIEKQVEKRGVQVTVHQILGFEGMNYAQAYGSMITYFRRYALGSMLGLITDKDTDGTGNGPDNGVGKPVINFGTDKYKKAVEYVASNKGDTSVIESSYSVSQKVLSQIKEDAKKLMKTSTA